jgi:serine/threonine protein kinase/Tol biopolymer transport system component
MSLAIGSQLGSHEIIALLGEGGMGEVYRARDTKLKRDVALKVLPETFARDPGRMARFQREAEVLASLNHYNIAHVYGVEELALAMELVEGQILPCPLPLDTAIAYAKQIADALEYAHERGVIHRDLKPANIKVTSDGVVKVLDFGLAKAVGEPEADTLNPSDSPTFTLGHTEVGVIMGTASYMAPEQAAGAKVDRRADIWSFGAVLFEMLTGKRAFEGESAADTLASVMKLDPDWNALPQNTPASIHKLLRRCLTKDRKQRMQAIGEARIVLEKPDDLDSPVQDDRQARPRSWMPWIVTGVFGLALASLTFIHFREPILPVPKPVRFQVSLPENVVLQRTGVSLSPDGGRIAFTAAGEDSKYRVWVRSLDSLEARPLAGTDGAAGWLFWSFDSRFVVFGVPGKIKKIDVTGGLPQTICDVPSGTLNGGFWTPDGRVVFGYSNSDNLFQVAAGGGVPQPVAALPRLSAGFNGFPAPLPDGKHFLFVSTTGGAGNSGVYMGLLDARPGEKPKRLLSDRSPTFFVASSNQPDDGYLLYVRERSLMAQPFNLRRLGLTGDAISTGVEIRYGQGVSVSRNGALVYLPDDNPSQIFAWYDRQGKALGSAVRPGQYESVALAPGGKQLAITQIDNQGPSGAKREPYLIDVERGVPTRFTSDPADSPVWSPDGSSIVFNSRRDDGDSLFLKPAAGGDEVTLVKGSDAKYPEDWSRDGRFLIYENYDPKTRRDLWVLPMQGERKPEVFLRTGYNEGQARFSPDTRWVAYSSDETGTSEVYVRPFPPESGSGKKVQVSNGGGGAPRWRGDGKELIYITREGKLMAVDVSIGPSFKAGAPHLLFQATAPIPGDAPFSNWNLTADGQRFLIRTPEEQRRPASITVVLNWQAGLKK